MDGLLGTQSSWVCHLAARYGMELTGGGDNRALLSWFRTKSGVSYLKVWEEG